MRTENLRRLENLKLTKFNFYYLHYKSFYKELALAINKYATGKVLDIGCGNKPYEKLFGQKITDYIGCDIVQSNSRKVDILCQGNSIPLASNSFDTVFSTQTIEHMEDHQGLINESFRLIKPGGYFILSGPMYWHLHEEPHDFFRFTRFGFQYILEKAGFKVEEINPNGGMWAMTGQTLIHAIINSNSKSFFIRSSCYLFKKCRLCWFINLFFSWMDKVDYNPRNTLNYVVIGKKPITDLNL
ncbi:class I SAM-dependent methyltransferase [Ginsengibacter hankyongi]|uniref:Class I SAM-dependent methyltransferase n=1 Tax=Ginsengibacter hankyongi TaxID=2607284 RepID=A0A5J5IDX3_9BACT|nr:class I SAM-dependent methyltransferase [Ginsengibacter hankyongi]KAA9034603.1 class I SAM-dependent methyltransferase [Ginsengibacter hankyongi]